MRLRKELKSLILISLCLGIIPIFSSNTASAEEEIEPVFYVSILAPSTCPARNQWATLMVEQLPKIGIGIEIFDHTGWSQIVPRTWGYPGPYPIPTYAEGGFDILFVGYSGDLDWYYANIFHSDYIIPLGENFYQYESWEYDFAYNNYMTSLTAEDRIFWGNKMQQILYKDQPACTIFYPTGLFAHDPDFTGWAGILWNTVYQFMENWTIPGQTDFHYASPAVFEDFHALHSESVYDARWLSQIYGSLLERSFSSTYNRNYAPHIATSYSSADGLTYNIHLNPNAVWADGHVLNASDIEYTYQLLVNPDFMPITTYCLPFITNESINIISQFEFDITFTMTYAFQENNLAVEIIPKHIWEPILPENHSSQALTWAMNDTLDSQKIIGSGPYYLDDYDQTLGIIHLKRNNFYDDWTGITPYFEDIYFEFYPTKEGALSALAAGDLDMVDSQYVPQLAEVPATVGYTLVDEPGYHEMALNNLNPYFGTGELCPIPGSESARHVRHAMSHMIPRDAIVDEILEGLGKPGVTPCPSIAAVFNDSIEPFEYNRNHAIEHMIAAGFDIPYTPSIGLGLTFPIMFSIIALIGGCCYFIQRKKSN